MLAYKFPGSIVSHWRKLKISHYCLKNSKILHMPQISYVHVYHGHVEEEEEDTTCGFVLNNYMKHVVADLSC